ncbi:MAG: hypothetical protein K0S88_1453, partial [Actinomycetia bacterium]|nr:hypothetical protein [Actinomycetes bacterium]
APGLRPRRLQPHRPLHPEVVDRRAGGQPGRLDLAMLPVILSQGWETLGEARERDEHDEDLTGIP